MVFSNPAMTPTLGGQIVRVYLENFMTHNSVEIRPGYHLNMIIGANGTGKSTIVCAVLLGLGGKLKTLGRADNLGSYVKSGCDQSLIEIELYDPNGENIVIKRIISSSNQSQFYINDVASTSGKVNDIRVKFNIQVDNLCTFLPQEKVQDFAKMNPHDLLVHTERTIDHGELLGQHENLNNMRKELLQFQDTAEKEERELNTLIAKNERLAPKVAAIKEKQAHCEKIELLNQKKHWLMYHKAIETKKAVEKDVKIAKDLLAKKKKELETAQSQLQNIEDNSKTQQEACLTAKREENAKKAVVVDRLDRLQQRMDSFSHLDASLQDRLAEESKKKNEVGSCQTVVDKLTNDLDTLDRSDEVESGLKQEDKKLQNEMQKKNELEMSCVRQIGATEEEVRVLQQELRNVSAEKRLLENRRSERLEFLRNHEKDVYQSVKWLEQNQHLFRGKVYNPMLLELDVENQKFASAVEATIPYNDLIAFSVTYSEDLNTLVHNLRVKQKLRVNIVTAEFDKDSQYSPSVPISQLRQYGFHAYIKDFIVGPEPILQYLCRNYRIHNIPVGDSRVKSASEVIPSSIRKYFSEDQIFSVSISTYSKARSTVVRNLGTTKFFTESVDTNKIASLDRRSNDIRKKMEAMEQELRDLAQRQLQLRETVHELRQRRREIATRLEERDKIVGELARAKARLESVKKTLLDPKALEEEINRQKKSLEGALDRAFSEAHKAQTALEEAYLKRCKSLLLLKTCRIGIGDVQERIREGKEALVKCLDAVRLVDDRYRAVEIECNRARTAARELTEGYCPGDSNFRTYSEKFSSLSDSIEELQTELAETQARADFLDDGSAQFLNQYQEQEERIKKMQSCIEKVRENSESKLREIQTNREKWLTPIHELVTKVNDSFGNYFQAMGCAGEVVLQIPEDENDFEAYGIRIRVKFRDSVPLQDLSRHFQSGGERAVSTAIYMLSLQNLTSVPFRFVDEINQGMDPTNERRITDLIIHVTTPIDSSQYFFITPKLMPDLKCPDTMTILCVYNGPSAIPASEWDIEKFERRARGIQEDDDC